MRCRRCLRHNSLCWARRLPLVVVAVAFLLLLVAVAPQGAHAQRAVVSLGARLRNRLSRNKSANSNSNGADIIQGEPAATTKTTYSLWWWDENERLKPRFAWSTAVVTLLLLALGYFYVFKNEQPAADEEGEFFWGSCTSYCMGERKEHTHIVNCIASL